MSQSLEALKELIHKKLGIEHCALDAEMPLEDFGIDSLGLVELLFAIEDHFSISLPDIQPTDIPNLSALAVVVDAALSTAAA
ncbi:MAG: acyl carrier protein [Pseudomonadota bacterium]